MPFRKYKEPVELYYCTKFLLSLQDPYSGAWGDIRAQTKTELDPFITAWAVYALSRMKSRERQKAEAWLISNVESFVKGQKTPYVSRDCAAIASTVISLNETHRLKEIYSLKDEIHRLFSERFDNENGWFDNVVYSSIILIALKILGYDQQDDLVKRGINWLKRERGRVNGMWGNDPKRAHFAIWSFKAHDENAIACVDAKKMYISLNELGFEKLSREDFLYFLWMIRECCECLESEKDYQRNLDELHKVVLQQINTIYTKSVSDILQTRKAFMLQDFVEKPETVTYFNGGEPQTSSELPDLLRDFPASVTDFILYTILVSKFREDIPIHVSEKELEQLKKQLGRRRVFRGFALVLLTVETYLLSSYIVNLSIPLEALSASLLLEFYFNSAIIIAVMQDKLNDLDFVDFIKGWRSQVLFWIITIILYAILFFLGKIPKIPL